MLTSRTFKDDITYWGSPVPDGFGGSAFSAPITFKGRWEEKAEQVMSPTGDLIVSQVVLFSPRDLLVGGYVALGRFIVTNPNSVPSSFRIRAWAKIPDLRRIDYERKAFL